MKGRTGSSQPVSIRFSSEEKSAIEQAAARDGLSFGAWIRHVAVLACNKNLRIEKSVAIKRIYRRSAETES